jgi:serine/threonine protein kinase
VKPENVLCGPSASDDVQLADFGSALQLDDQACHMLPPDTGLSMGTALYASPEVLRVECVSPASDMWSVGVLTYVLLSGCFPFSSATETLSHRASFAAEPWRSHVSPAGREFIVSLLRHDPTRRLTAEQALQHPWLAPAVRCETPPPAAEAVAPPEPHTPTKRARHTDSLWSTDEEGSVHEGKRAKPLPAEPSHVCVSQLSELCAVP